MVDYGYNDIEKWIDFLIELETKMTDLAGKLLKNLHLKQEQTQKN